MIYFIAFATLTAAVVTAVTLYSVALVREWDDVQPSGNRLAVAPRYRRSLAPLPRAHRSLVSSNR